MAVLKDLIVHGRSRFINGIDADSIHVNLIDANDGVFKTITTTTLDAETITTEMLSATNARVAQTLTVEGTISTNKWEAANIANIGGNFYISPTGKADSGTITVTKTGSVTINGVSVGTYTLVVGSASFGVTSTNSTVWGPTSGNQSKVIFTGSISYNNSKKYPLGTCNGTMTALSTGTNTLTGFTITGVSSPALDIFFQEVGVSSVSSTACNGYEMQISVYQTYSNSALRPVGILLTSYGKEKKQYIDIYNGENALGDSASGFATPGVRIGLLDGLPDIRDGVTASDSPTKPSGWGIYTQNGFFKGKIVSNAGIIANFTISNGKLYSNNHSAYNTAVTGIYIGDDYISFGSGGVTYFNTSGTGKIGPWTLTTTALYNSKSSYNASVSGGGVYIGTDYIAGGNGEVWWLKKDGSAKIGAMTLTAAGVLSVPAANITGDLSADRIKTNVLSALQANLTNANTKYLSAIVADIGTITAGVIKHDTVGGTNGIWFSAATDTSSNVTVGNSGARKDWRLLVNNKFGVTTGGVLYASGGSFNGRIEATEGYFASSVTIGFGGTSLSTVESNASQGAVAKTNLDSLEGNLALYTPLEYLQSSGTQRIDTGIKRTAYPFKIETQVTYVNSISGELDYAGDYGASSAGIVNGIYSGAQLYQWGGSVWCPGGIAVSLNTQYSVCMEYPSASSRRAIINGVEYLNNITNSMPTPGSYNIGLFSGAGNKQYCAAQVRLTYARIYIGGVLVRDYIPVKRKSDNVLGMYDLLNNVFYTNAGTGTFTAGPEVSLLDKQNLLNAQATVYNNLATSRVPNYITEIDSNGIWVTPSGKKPTNTSTGAGATGTKIDGTGVDIYQNGASVAFYGATARIGKSSTARIEIDSSPYINLYNSSNKLALSVQSGGLYLYDQGGTLRGSITSSDGVIMGQASKGHTKVTDAGLVIYDTNNKQRVYVDSNGLAVYDGSGTAATNILAQFGSTLRIGKTSTSNVTITPTGSTAGISFKADSSKVLAEFAVDTTDSSATSEGWPMAAWFTLGNRAGAKGYYSLAGGYNITAKGWASFGYGIDCEAYGDTSVAIGNGCRTGASDAGIHQGDSNLAGWCSAAIGSSCVAHGNSQVVVGGANIIDTAHNYVFIIGNGTTSARSDALRVDWNGGIQMYLDSNGTSSANATSGTDKDLFNAIRTLGWYSAVIS